MFKNYRLDSCYLIAEIGGNFTTIEQAVRLIDEAAACGVDAVKLQTYRAETLSIRQAMFDFLPRIRPTLTCSRLAGSVRTKF